MRRLAYILIFLFVADAVKAQEPDLLRICASGNDNNIYWSNPTSGCASFHYFIIWERKGNSGPFLPVDTIINALATSYLHPNATPPLSEPNSFYFIERRDSCGPTFNFYSDTMKVDLIPPDISDLDSVSVDINTNQVILGWRRNTSPDFDKFLMYILVGSFFNAMTPSETRDTFATDLGGTNPSAGSYTYTINTRDSCGQLPDHEKRHSTIYLTNSTDTCARSYRLAWTHYEGWSAIRRYYIYRKINTGIFELLDSVSGTTSTYQGAYVSGNSYEFYVRAFKDTSNLITSSSNKTSFSIRKRQDPESLIIEYVTSGAPNNNDLFFSFSTNAADEVSSYELNILDSTKSIVNLLSLDKTDINQIIPLGLTSDTKYNLVINAKDVCEKTSFTSDTSGNIVLVGNDNNGLRQVRWNPYFTWNTGVEKYLIYRGTGSNNTFVFNLWKSSVDTMALDSELIEEIGDEGVCYYIEAQKQGNNTIVAKSNIRCLSYPFSVFIPNAFRPDGVSNPTFRPEGSLIDYEKSVLKVYDRWGKLIFDGPIVNGWDGNDNNQPCTSGIYYYYTEIISKENERTVKNGTVTLLR